MSVRPLVLTVAFFGTALPCLPQNTAVWVGSWFCSQQIPEPHNALPPEDLRDATLRQVVHLSAGGTAIRIHLSNSFGVAPLHLTAVHVARPTSISTAQIDTSTDKAFRFAGQGDVLIPPGAEYVSEPLQLAVQPGSDLTVSIHYDDPPQQQTGHPGSRATSYLTHGDLVSAADLPDAKKIEHWYQISAVDVLSDADAFSVVALGDSITDGHGATTNGNNRWPDLLARRLQAAGFHNIGVLNAGIGGNNLLKDGLGPNALARFDRDVLSPTGVRFVIVLEGVNDLGGLARTRQASPADHSELVRRIIGVYEQIIDRAHAHKLLVIGATILPYVGSNYYRPDAASEADRQNVNNWIRKSGRFDSVVDLDQVARDPAHPEMLLPAYDSGDHLHPSPTGYEAMANAIPLSIFRRH